MLSIQVIPGWILIFGAPALVAVSLHINFKESEKIDSMLTSFSSWHIVVRDWVLWSIDTYLSINSQSTDSIDYFLFIFFSFHIASRKFFITGIHDLYLGFMFKFVNTVKMVSIFPETYTQVVRSLLT